MAPIDCPTLAAPEDTKENGIVTTETAGEATENAVDKQGSSSCSMYVNPDESICKKAVSQNFIDEGDGVTHPPDLEDGGSPNEPEYVQKSCFVLNFIHCFCMCFGCRPIIDRCQQCACIKRIAAILLCPVCFIGLLAGKCKGCFLKCPCFACVPYCMNGVKACCSKCVTGCGTPCIKCKGCFLALPCVRCALGCVAKCKCFTCCCTWMKCSSCVPVKCMACFSKCCLKLRQAVQNVLCCCSFSIFKECFGACLPSTPGCVCIFPSTLCGCGCACPKCCCVGCFSPCRVMTPEEKEYWEERAHKGLLYVALAPCRFLVHLVRMLIKAFVAAVRALCHVAHAVAKLLVLPCLKVWSLCKSSPTTVESDLEQQTSIVPLGDEEKRSIGPCVQETSIADVCAEKAFVMENVVTVSGTPISHQPGRACADDGDDFDTEATVEK